MMVTRTKLVPLWRLTFFCCALCIHAVGATDAVENEPNKDWGFWRWSGPMQRSLEQEAAHNDRYLKQQNHLRGLGLFGNDETEAPIEDSDKEGIDLIESVPCEPVHSKAVDFVEMYGDLKAGNAACAAEADPDSCGGGCCRFGAFFICDEDNRMAHLPCVCNRNTNEPKDYTVSFSEPEHDKDGEATADGPTAAPGVLDSLMGYLSGGDTNAPVDAIEKDGPMAQEFEAELNGGGEHSSTADVPTDDSVVGYDSDSAGTAEDISTTAGNTSDGGDIKVESGGVVDKILDTVGLGGGEDNGDLGETEKDFDPSQMLTALKSVKPKSGNETDDLYPEEYLDDNEESTEDLGETEKSARGVSQEKRKDGVDVNATKPHKDDLSPNGEDAANGGILGVFGIGGQDENNQEEPGEAVKAGATGGEGSRKSIGSDASGMFDFLNLTKTGDKDKSATGGEGSRKSIGSDSSGMFDFLNLTKSGDDENSNCGGDSGTKCGEPETEKAGAVGGEGSRKSIGSESSGMFDFLNLTKSGDEDKSAIGGEGSRKSIGSDSSGMFDFLNLTKSGDEDKAAVIEGNDSDSGGMFDFLTNGGATATEGKVEEEGSNTTDTRAETKAEGENETTVEKEEEELVEAEEELSEVEKDLADILGELSGGGS